MTHIIVGDVTQEAAPIVYRRHRLASYVHAQPETSAVYWISARLPGERREGNAPTPDVPLEGCRVWNMAVPHALARYVEPLQGRPLAPLVRALQERRAGERLVLWLTVPQLSRLLRAVPWDLTIYDCSDNWSGRRPGRSPASRLVHGAAMRSERRIAERCDVLFASSTFLAERMARKFGREATVVENGVDFDAFERVRSDRATDEDLPPRPRLAFVGALKPYKIDFDLLASVARTTPSWSYVLVGPHRHATPELRSLLALPNVHALGYRAPEEIPSLTRQMDVGLLPYRTGPYTAGVFPLKLFEYLAAGLPVVGCGLPSTLHHVREGVYAHTEPRPEAFLEGCRRALSWGDERDVRTSLARRNDWEARLRTMYEAVVGRLSTSG